MKKIYLIQYDIDNKDSTILIKKIKSLGSWINYFNDNWIIKTELSATEIYNQISVGFEDGSFLIIELKKNFWGRMEPTLWEWLGKE